MIPRRAKTVRAELPCAGTRVAALRKRFTGHLSVRRKGHFEFSAGRRSGRESLAREEGCLNLARRHRLCSKSNGRCDERCSKCEPIKAQHCEVTPEQPEAYFPTTIAGGQAQQLLAKAKCDRLPYRVGPAENDLSGAARLDCPRPEGLGPSRLRQAAWGGPLSCVEGDMRKPKKPAPATAGLGSLPPQLIAGRT